MTNKKRKISTSSPIKVEVKEENVMGNDYLMAKGRLKGVLKQLTERSESDSDSSEDKYYEQKRESRKRKTSQATPVRHTYVVKLFDRSVDLARFEEDTPLYPICRAWMANLPRNPQVVIKRRNSSPESENMWNENNFNEVTRLPPPRQPTVPRIPNLIQEQLNQDKNDINLNYEEKPAVLKEDLVREHLKRWGKIKKKWIETSKKNEGRYIRSHQIFESIYNKAQEALNQS